MRDKQVALGIEKLANLNTALLCSTGVVTSVDRHGMHKYSIIFSIVKLIRKNFHLSI